MNCEKCASLEVTAELRTGGDGGPAGMGFRCMDCGHTWLPAPFAGKNVAPIGAPEKPAPPPRPAAKQAATKPLTTRSIVAEARKELKRLDAEIARLNRLQKQRDELSRLLDAATGAGKLIPIKCAVNQR